MKFIKSYKESTEDGQYKIISWREFNKIIDKTKREYFSIYEIEAIKKICQDLSFYYKNAKIYDLSKTETIQVGPFNINKFYDEWYTIHERIGSYYLCDGFKGVLNFINDYVK